MSKWTKYKAASPRANFPTWKNGHYSLTDLFRFLQKLNLMKKVDK